jgi:hypothetical protein
MERGAATQGKVARAIEGAESIEIKATISDHQIDGALARFGLTARNDEERYIYFFDTPELALLGAGIIARARRTVGDEHDSTVKFRPVNPAEVGGEWRKFHNFKIEADASETSLVKSASFSMKVAPGLIKRVAVGKKPIAAAFTQEQEDFIVAMTGQRIDFSKLAVLGPLMAQRWQIRRSRLSLANFSRTLAARGRRATPGSLHQGAGGASRSRSRWFHGLPGRDGRRARQERADQDPLGFGSLCCQAVGANPPGGVIAPKAATRKPQLGNGPPSP